MKKIINGRKYDTETARELATDSSNEGLGSFYWYEETLYVKRTGEYFLYGRGNAASKYAQAAGQHGWWPGDGFEPLTEEEARRWAEDRLDADEYEAIFGEAEE